MAQDATIGRCGLATASGGDGLELKIGSWRQDGDRARVSFIVRRQASLADAKALRDQLQGYGPENTDEPVVPVTSAEDSSRDGFYEVLSIDGSEELSQRLGSPSEAGTNVAYTFSADLLRVPGWQAPLFEVAYTGNDRDTAHAITPNKWVSSPATTVTPGPVASSHGVAGDTGSLTVDLVSAYSGELEFIATPSTHYSMAARIEVSRDSGVTWRTVIGRQIPSLPLHWRLTNGVGRVYPASPGPDFTVGFYDSATANAWEEQDFTPGEGTSITPVGATWVNAGLTVLCNSPERVAVRVRWAGSTGYLDFTLNRGQSAVECFWYQDDTNKLGVARSSADAGTSTTGGVEDTTATSGNKWQLISPQAVTAVVAGSAGIYQTAADPSFPFMVANTLTHGVAGGLNPRTMYFAAMQHRQRIVAG